MTHYILVHGSRNTAKEFEDVFRLLSADGIKIIAPDFTDHSERYKPITKATMDSYVLRVIDIINDINEKVILVGYSMAEKIISQVAEAVPEHIERLICIAAVQPKTGNTPPTLIQSDTLGNHCLNLSFLKIRPAPLFKRIRMRFFSSLRRRSRKLCKTDYNACNMARSTTIYSTCKPE